MKDRYDGLRVSPDPTRAEELRERLHAQIERSSLGDAAASRARLGVAHPEPGNEFEPMEEMLMSDVDSPDREHKNRWRLPAIAAAAVVVLGVGAIALAVSNNDADDDAPSEAPEPTAAPPTAAPATTIAPRTETGSFAGADPIVPLSYTVPDGWQLIGEWGLANTSAAVHFYDIANLFADGCTWDPVDPPVGPTVDDLATAWATLPGFTATPPVDVTVDGYTGKQVEFAVPDYNLGDCEQNQFLLWTAEGQDFEGGHWALFPKQQNRQLILDVDGTRLVITAQSSPDASPEDLAAIDQILASVQIG